MSWNDIRLLDYVQDTDDNFWIVNDLREGEPRGFMVFEVCYDGPRFNPAMGKPYQRLSDQGIGPVPEVYKRVFRPLDFYKEHRDELTGVWQNYAVAMNKIGVPDSAIGIFGSYLLGFPVQKDVDFVIYGLENLELYYNNQDFFKQLLQAGNISPEHVAYQAQKYSGAFSPRYDLKTVLGRNWSGVQFGQGVGVLSTPRFIDPNRSITPTIAGENTELSGVEVVESLGSALLPRRVKVRVPGRPEIFELVSPLWMLQSFARRGDILDLCCLADFAQKLLVVSDRQNHHVQFRKKSSLIR